MHIKINRKIKEKKEGYVLLESIVILMLVAFIAMLLNKVVVNNYLQSSVVNIRENIRTLTTSEENMLLDAIEFFNNDESKTKYEEIYGKEKITITIEETSGTLVKEDENKRELYIYLNCEKKTINGKRVINLTPKTYRTKYMI